MTKIQALNLNSDEMASAMLSLLNSYACDPMGGGKALDERTRQRLPAALLKRNDLVSFLAFDQANNSEAIGLINAFEGFSTFSAMPLINIHDIYVKPEWRGKGVCKKLVLAVEKVAIQRRCCKLTLEVLDKNHMAKRAYRKLGFSGYELDPDIGQAVFWQKEIG